MSSEDPGPCLRSVTGVEDVCRHCCSVYSGTNRLGDDSTHCYLFGTDTVSVTKTGQNKKQSKKDDADWVWIVQFLIVPVDVVYYYTTGPRIQTRDTRPRFGTWFREKLPGAMWPQYKWGTIWCAKCNTPSAKCAKRDTPGGSVRPPGTGVPSSRCGSSKG